jgi:DNA-binding NarL/FixJ family response regulator
VQIELRSGTVCDLVHQECGERKNFLAPLQLPFSDNTVMKPLLGKQEDLPAPPQRRRIFIVDDHAVVRQGMAFLINLQPDMEICGQADSASSGFQGILELQPCACLIDISLPGGNGIELIKQVRGVLPQLSILVVSMHDERIYAERAIRAGASGYIMKAAAIENVVHALRTVLGGGMHLDPAIAGQILSSRLRGRGRAGGDPSTLLSDRELEVFQLIGQWKGTREIAGALNLSVKTVEHYREQIKKKLNLRTGGELVQAATTWAESVRV